MRARASLMLAAAICAFLPGDAPAVQAVTVGSIEIRGLKYMTRGEILEGVRMKADGGAIVVDLVSLKSALAASRMLERSSIDISGNTLLITVRERVPAGSALLKNGNDMIPLELDRRGAVISARRVHALIRPLVVLREKDIVNGAITPEIAGLYRLLGRVRTLCPSLYREMTEVEPDGRGMILVRLRGRKTEYLLEQEPAQFLRLQYLAGHLDMKKTHARHVTLAGAGALVRQ